MTDEKYLSFILLHQVSMLALFRVGKNLVGRATEAWIAALWSPS